MKKCQKKSPCPKRSKDVIVHSARAETSLFPQNIFSTYGIGEQMSSRLSTFQVSQGTVEQRRNSMLMFSIFAAAILLPQYVSASEIETLSGEKPGVAEPELWEIGAFIDAAYLLDFNFPPNHQFRSRSTTPRVNELNLNMGGISLSKEVRDSSRWGGELLVQAGEDSKTFGFSVNAPNVGSADELRHFGRANVSYLAPVGRGVLVQAGLFNSLMGYESLYAKDNANYTRAWVSEYSPYLMFGINASYPLTPHLTGTVFVINGYAHLAHANNVPSYGAQLAWELSPKLLLQQTVYLGPDQSDTDLEFWRLFSDSIARWRDGPLTIALDYQIGTERVAGQPGNPRTFWTGASLPVQWHVAGPWSVAVRPEMYWDRNGRISGFEQFIKTVTTTVEHRSSVGVGEAIFRLEYRFDESTGPQGGFFKKVDNPVDSLGLTAAQHLLIFSAIWTFMTPL